VTVSDRQYLNCCTGSLIKVPLTTESLPTQDEPGEGIDF